MGANVANMEFDKRKGFQRGMTVRYMSEKGDGVGIIESLYHASALVRKDDGETVVIRYREMTSI